MGSDQFSDRQGNKGNNSKVVEGVFIDPDEIVDAEEVNEREENAPPGWLPQVKFGAVAHFVCGIILFVSLIVLLWSIATFGAAAIIAAVGALFGGGSSKELFWQRWRRLRRVVVIALSAFVGIFSPLLALVIGYNYFVYIDPAPEIIAKVQSYEFGSR